MVTPTDSTATSALLRRLNATAVLDVLRDTGPVTAAELMTATGLSRPTVHTVCDLLIARGWVTELDSIKTTSGVGRRARCYQFNATAGYVFGVDLKVEQVSVLLSDLRGATVGSLTRSFDDPLAPARERVRVTRRLIAAVLAASGVAPERVAATVVAVPAALEDSGRVHASEAYLPGMAGTDLRTAIGKGYSWPVLVGNDANLAVLGERWRGAGRGVDNLIVLLAGERIGAGIYLAGRLISGSNGTAGEMHFLELVDQVGSMNGIDYFLRTLGAEAVASAGQEVLAGKVELPVVGENGSGSLRARASGHPDRVDAQMVADAARAGDPVAIGVIEQVADRIARIVAVLGALLNPELVVVAGPSESTIEVLLTPLEQLLPKYTLFPPAVAATMLGDRGVLLGAVRLAIDHVEAQLVDRFAPPPSWHLGAANAEIDQLR